MGLDLEIIIDKAEGVTGKIFSSLPFDRNEEFFDKVKELKARVLDVNLKIDGVYVTEDLYGNPLTWVTASELVGIEYDHQYEYNRAIIAFLRVINPATRVILYWS